MGGLSCSLCQGNPKLLVLKHACPSWVPSKKARNAQPKHSSLPLEMDAEFNLQCLAQRWACGRASVNASRGEGEVERRLLFWICHASSGSASWGRELLWCCHGSDHLTLGFPLRNFKGCFLGLVCGRAGHAVCFHKLRMLTAKGMCSGSDGHSSGSLLSTLPRAPETLFRTCPMGVRIPPSSPNWEDWMGEMIPQEFNILPGSPQTHGTLTSII